MKAATAVSLCAEGKGVPDHMHATDLHFIDDSVSNSVTVFQLNN